jgi:hypothetical protein
VIQPPLIAVDRDGCVYIFDSIGDAEAELESPDIEDEEYRVYDSEGRTLEFGVVRSDAPLPWWRKLRHQDPIQLSSFESAPTGEADARAAVMRGLRGRLPDEELEHLSLADLVATARRMSDKGFLAPMAAKRRR